MQGRKGEWLEAAGHLSLIPKGAFIKLHCDTIVKVCMFGRIAEFLLVQSSRAHDGQTMLTLGSHPHPQQLLATLETE